MGSGRFLTARKSADNFSLSYTSNPKNLTCIARKRIDSHYGGERGSHEEHGATAATGNQKIRTLP